LHVINRVGGRPFRHDRVPADRILMVASAGRRRWGTGARGTARSA
jgi:hypothetical protein